VLFRSEGGREGEVTVAVLLIRWRGGVWGRRVEEGGRGGEEGGRRAERGRGEGEEQEGGRAEEGRLRGCLPEEEEEEEEEGKDEVWCVVGLLLNAAE
jgi:hypothetical protein